jgi:serine/threonine-protein kinase
MVLYEMVAGLHPFARGSAHATLLRVYDGVVPDIRTFDPGVPAPLAELLCKALHVHRGRRPASAREFGEALQGVRTALTMERSTP